MGRKFFKVLQLYKLFSWYLTVTNFQKRLRRRCSPGGVWRSSSLLKADQYLSCPFQPSRILRWSSIAQEKGFQDLLDSCWGRKSCNRSQSCCCNSSFIQVLHSLLLVNQIWTIRIHATLHAASEICHKSAPIIKPRTETRLSKMTHNNVYI